jgi:RsiW-degrading membrane proteinase PrsW (M82 family)
MPELGQFLAGPGSMLNWPSRWLALGLLALCITLALPTVLLRPLLARDVRTIRLLAYIPLFALVSVLAVILFQWAAQWIHQLIYSRPLVAAQTVAAGRGERDVIFRIAVLILAFLVGWGYSRSLQPDSFGEHIFSFTLGTGVLEEAVKAVVGMIIFAVALDEFSRGEKVARRPALAFILAGLSFGAGEAIFYFQAYSGMDLGPSYYVLRAVWCVLLHASWAFLTAVLLYVCVLRIGDFSRDLELAAKAFLCILPAALLHGIYDACCMHSATAMWVVGGLCLAVSLFALLLLLRELPNAESTPVPKGKLKMWIPACLQPGKENRG